MTYTLQLVKLANVVKLNENLYISTFWDIALCSTYVDRRFGGTHHFHLQCRKSSEQETGVQQEAWTLKKDVIGSFETSV
jgi:hypothetical protein